MGVPGRWIISFRWDSETGLAASLKQILDKAWLAYGTHRQPGDHGGVVLREWLLPLRFCFEYWEKIRCAYHVIPKRGVTGLNDSRQGQRLKR